ncbi:hypothetical protein F9288_14180 [Sphingomonas sp. CL5.1]|uniref:hypothetical protein n=1 Tax=Sphingomonas sp. CL5.1 TaxID=2653203 RepID=UPI0015828BAE|nr:hypothetical protein [Sphingomonas sp. CL5.1]QKS00640.1 hypothetical protein F9288_14180 [Sphingomonas sp. CL5.1]
MTLKVRRKRISSARPLPASLKKKRGPKPRPVVALPEAKSGIWADKDAFHEALAFHIERHGDTVWHLHKAITGPKDRVDRKTIAHWAAGTKVPRSVTSLELLGRIERRYQLPLGYFASKLPHTDRAASGHTKLGDMKPSERRRIAWHLPSDFDRRSLKECDEILAWVRKVIVSGATDYRLYQAAAMQHRYALRFPDPANLAASVLPGAQDESDEEEGDDVEIELAAARRDAPRRLIGELAHLVRFKTATLTEIGFQRNGVWNDATAFQKVDHLGLLFGAMAADPQGPVAGLGVPLSKLTMALLVFPAVWDWYVQWRERRRGFYTIWEVNMIQLGLALTRAETGWLRQRPDLARALRPISGLVSQDDIDRVVADWEGACEAFYQHGMVRAKELQRVARVHRDTFEPIMAVLEADSPVGEYRRIADEVVRLMPRKDRYPKAAAEAVRSILMIRLGLHLGVRQKNLRELLFCPRHEQPSTERQLETRRCGEMRWSDKEKGWEVLIPAAAFKNANSSFFSARPFRLVLPDVGDLYRYISAWIRDHRALLLNGAKDPGTFFVKTVKSTSQDAAYSQSSFYEAWRLIIQRYGIYNPYTGRGAIKGLLPHGPHSVRDVLATHVLKETGSYEQAGYAIQDTAEIVAEHYGRFLPENKVALAAKVINKVWEVA